MLPNNILSLDHLLSNLKNCTEMGFPLFIPLLLLQLLARVSCELCPSAEDIFPCKCDYSTGIYPVQIGIYCNSVSWKEIDQAFDQLRGKTVATVRISYAEGDRMPSNLFRDTGVRFVFVSECDLQGLSDSDGSPAFRGLENSLTNLTVANSIKGDNRLETLDLSHLKQLQGVVFSGNNIPEVGNDWFAKGPLSLTSLEIKHCGLDKLGDTAFAPLVNLRKLSLWGGRLAAIHRSTIPNPASHLEILNLYNHKLSSVPSDMFTGMPSLRNVYLNYNSIIHIEEKTWSSVWEHLDNLYIKGNPLECDSRMKWMFSLMPPRYLDGICDSPASVKYQPLLYFIESNRKLQKKYSFKEKNILSDRQRMPWDDDNIKTMTT